MCTRVCSHVCEADAVSLQPLLPCTLKHELAGNAELTPLARLASQFDPGISHFLLLHAGITGVLLSPCSFLRGFWESRLQPPHSCGMFITRGTLFPAQDFSFMLLDKI